MQDGWMDGRTDRQIDRLLSEASDEDEMEVMIVAVIIINFIFTSK